MAAGCCPAKILALTEDMGTRLDQSQFFRSIPKFWSAVHFFRQLPGKTGAAKTSANYLARRCVGRAGAGVIQTASNNLLILDHVLPRCFVFFHEP
jgi:hypothetical protein